MGTALLFTACDDVAPVVSTPTIDAGTDAGWDGGTDKDSAPADSAADTSAGPDDAAHDSTSEVSPPAIPIGACDYTNPFSQGPECREFIGGDWSASAAEADCAESSDASFRADGSCSVTPADHLGVCVTDGEGPTEVRTYLLGTDTGSCELSQVGCEVFGGGVFTPTTLCTDPPVDPPTGGPPVFQWPVLECVTPLDGEPAGQSDGGDVCTWQMIGGCTEEGRKFKDYATCEPVFTQRPYYPSPAAEIPDTADPRLDDPGYVTEADWVKSQIESCGCVCCHSTELAPEGTSAWYIEAPNNWINSFADTGLAFAANWVDSTALGAFNPDDNNGFNRTEVGLPSTDPARMVAFFEAELAWRGRTKQEFADAPSTPEVLYEQLVYAPEPCEAGVGVEVDGTINWGSGKARYIYILEADSMSPGVPPNLDTPEGTVWRIDTPVDKAPVTSGSVTYGSVPSTMFQRVPAQGEAPTLQTGKTYYLHVLADVIQPLKRCTFTP